VTRSRGDQSKKRALQQCLLQAERQVEGIVALVDHSSNPMVAGSIPAGRTLTSDYVLIHTCAIMLVTRRLLLEDAAGKAGLLRWNEQTGHAADPTSRSSPGRPGSRSRSEVLPTCGRHGSCWCESQSSSGSSTRTSRWPFAVQFVELPEGDRRIAVDDDYLGAWRGPGAGTSRSTGSNSSSPSTGSTAWSPMTTYGPSEGRSG
jgi:hypothetical protein